MDSSVLKSPSNSGTFSFSGGGGVFCAPYFHTQEKFSFPGGGGGGGGILWDLDQKISTTPAGSCITDSLSHTAYVEINKMATVLNATYVSMQYVNRHTILKMPIFIAISLCYSER